MRKLMLLVCVGALAISACDDGNAPAEPTPVAPVATASVGAAPATESTEASEVASQMALLTAIYAAPERPDGPVEFRRFFSRDLAGALIADSASGEVGVIDSDYRYGSQDPQITDLTMTRESDGAVRVSFKDAGREDSVLWAFCSRDDTTNARVADVIHDEWSMTGAFEIEGGGLC